MIAASVVSFLTIQAITLWLVINKENEIARNRVKIWRF